MLCCLYVLFLLRKLSFDVITIVPILIMLSLIETSPSSSVVLPPDVFSQSGVADNEVVNTVFGVYESPAIFQQAKLGQNTSFAIASSILTISLVGHEVKDLTSDVIITMQLLSEV